MKNDPVSDGPGDPAATPAPRRSHDALEASGTRKPRNRVIVCTLPPGLPLPAGSLWPALEARGRPMSLRALFGTIQQEFIGALVHAADQQAEPSERAWIFESGGGASRTVADGTDGLTVLSYDALAPVRKEFLRRLNLVKKDLRSADRTYEELKQLNLSAFLDSKLGGDTRLSAFIRDLFLSGNGSVLFGNSFVEWGAAEAMRRAEPQVLVCSFGIRRKLKPFSSVVLFEDQSRANPVGEQDDPSSSLIDDQLLAEYVYLTAERLPAFRGRTLTVFAVADASSALLVGAPADLPVADLTSAVTGWLAHR